MGLRLRRRECGAADLEVKGAFIGEHPLTIDDIDCLNG